MTASYDWQANKSLAECNRYMLANDIAYDVGFLVGEHREVIGAHKYILISRSCVFFAMFQGLMAGKSDEYIAIPDIDRETFKQMLEFIYCEDTKVEIKNALSLLYAARKYGLNGLEEKCVRVLEHGITVENACSMLAQADKFDEIELKKKCLEFIYHQPKDILKSNSFCDLSESLVKEIVRSDDLDAKEDTIFNAILRWSELECMRNDLIVSPQNQRNAIGGILYYLRFPIMNEDYFNKVVVKTDLLAPSEINLMRKFFRGTEKDIKKFKCEKRCKGLNQSMSWRFGPVSCIHSEETAISFTASVEVLVEGVEVDGTGLEEEIYDATLAIYDISNTKLAETKSKIDLKKKHPTCKVLFPAAPKILKGYKYTVIFKIQGQHGYYGASGRSNLQINGTSPTCINPEGDFTKIISRKDHVPAILVRPYVWY